MVAEIITIGDEIITGFTTDTNSAWLSRALLDAGIRTEFHTSVGDTVSLIESAISVALKRADLVITTGGLGPTEDDLTKRAIVRVFRRNLVFN
ncbi:competence/damage-inducible protein A, partial [Gemmatimonas aurantiaca]|nr:competence/damage-inducible protein A [Gemmatimonas aurantiaca]